MRINMIRKIVHIDEEKCNGCGACANACHEDAIAMVDGKARLIKDDYCDGLGDCLPACPMDAIKIIEREANDYDEAAVKARIAAKKIAENTKKNGSPVHVCPGSMARKRSYCRRSWLFNTICDRISEEIRLSRYENFAVCI